MTVRHARVAEREATAATSAAEDLQRAAINAPAAAAQATAAAGAAAADLSAAAATATVASDGVPAAAAAAAAAAASVSAEEERPQEHKMRVYNVGRVSVGDLDRRPDLADIRAL